MLIDPNMITKCRGFNGDMDWLDYETEIDNHLDKQALTKEIKKELLANGNRLSEVNGSTPKEEFEAATKELN